MAEIDKIGCPAQTKNKTGGKDKMEWRETETNLDAEDEVLDTNIRAIKKEKSRPRAKQLQHLRYKIHSSLGKI
jgi:chaperonin cofactor prefoldin